VWFAKNKQKYSANHNCPNQARDQIIMLRMTINALVARRWIVRVIIKISLVQDYIKSLKR
jgi:hypothetical protein